MSQIQKLFDGSVKPDAETLTGDVGGAVGADAAFNINLLTGPGLTSTGNPATNTITFALDGDISTTFTAEDATVATPAGNNLNIVGNSTNGIDTTAAGDTLTISMSSPFYGDFSFTNLAPATSRSLNVINTDTNIASTAEMRMSVPTAGADPSVVWEIQATGFYSAGVDNSDADKWKLTNSSDPSSGNALISTTNTGVITLFNDLDVTEGGTGVSTLTSHGILMGNGTGDVQVTAEPSNGQLLVGKTGDFPQLATLTAGTGVSITNAAGSITVNAKGGGLTWSTIGASGALAINNGYICTAGAALSFSLPATSAGKYLDRPETPVFIGGMTQYIEFDEVVSKSATETEYGSQPLGDI